MYLTEVTKKQGSVITGNIQVQCPFSISLDDDDASPGALSDLTVCQYLSGARVMTMGH